jgi:hypothetical protein
VPHRVSPEAESKHRQPTGASGLHSKNVRPAQVFAPLAHVPCPVKQKKLPPKLKHCAPTEQQKSPHGVQHAPFWQVSEPAQGPHCPPQPSGPQRPIGQFGVQHLPALQVCPTLQRPHSPPQPSSPHCLLPHCRVQQAPATHVWFGPHVQLAAGVGAGHAGHGAGGALFFAFFFLPFFLAALSSGASPRAEVTSSPPARRLSNPRRDALVPSQMR